MFVDTPIFSQRVSPDCGISNVADPSTRASRGQIVRLLIHRLGIYIQIFLCALVQRVGSPIASLWILKFCSAFAAWIEGTSHQSVHEGMRDCWPIFLTNPSQYIFSSTSFLWDWLSAVILVLCYEGFSSHFLPTPKPEAEFQTVLKVRVVIDSACSAATAGLANWLVMTCTRTILVSVSVHIQ
jgi:hypothetical protein